MAPALELRGITKHFGPVQALRGADFILEEGEIHALLGENGAGKSTLMGVAFGLIRPDAGQVLVRGLSATDSGATRCPPTGHRDGASALHVGSRPDGSGKHRFGRRLGGFAGIVVRGGCASW